MVHAYKAIGNKVNKKGILLWHEFGYNIACFHFKVEVEFPAITVEQFTKKANENVRNTFPEWKISHNGNFTKWKKNESQDLTRSFSVDSKTDKS